METKNFYILLLASLYIICLSCNSHENKARENNQIPTDCSKDTLHSTVFYTSSNLLNSKEIILEHYVKGSMFKKLIKSEKRKIAYKEYSKDSKIWSFSFMNVNYINVNYDYLFIVPNKNDSDFYYVKDIKLIYRGSGNYYYTCWLKYTVNHYEREEKFELIYPFKIRVNTITLPR